MDIHTVTLNTIKVVRQSFQDRGDKGFNEFVDELFKKYNEQLHTIDNGCSFKSQLLEEVEFVEERIVDSINDYYSGSIMGASVEIQRLHSHFKRTLHVHQIKEGDIWYRGRIMKRGGRLFGRKEMFHIPDNCRENVSSQRFSFIGYPCLYLGKSIWDCWEELNEPYLDDICFSAFKATEDIKLANLTLPTIEMVENRVISNYYNLLSTLPLIILCSIKTLNENANFKPEYIIPQLLMMDLINYSKYDGYMFTSTKQNTSLNWDEGYLYNIVLPVSRFFDEEGLCLNLKRKFLVTDPVCYKYEYLKASISNLSFATEEDIERLFSNQIIENDMDPYTNSLFGQIENVLREKVFYQL